MTIEQILEIIERYKLRIPPTVFYDLKAEIVNYEEQEPTTKNDLGVDCISRAEAIKCLECDFDITGKENMKTVVNYINSAHDKIVNLPRVKQEPKTGHWIETHDDWGNGIITDRKYKCSVCHGKHIDPKTGEWHEVFDYKYPFCPNCGAKMAESEGKE